MWTIAAYGQTHSPHWFGLKQKQPDAESALSGYIRDDIDIAIITSAKQDM